MLYASPVIINEFLMFFVVLKNLVSSYFHFPKYNMYFFSCFIVMLHCGLATIKKWHRQREGKKIHPQHTGGGFYSDVW